MNPLHKYIGLDIISVLRDKAEPWHLLFDMLSTVQIPFFFFWLLSQGIMSDPNDCVLLNAAPKSS